MKVLIVCSENSGKIAPFIFEQVESINKLGVETDFFTIRSKGWKGYLKSRKELVRTINEIQPDLIHAHYGLSGLLANLQRKVPVITTYHGSDINKDEVYRFSKWAVKLSAFNIFVSKKNYLKAGSPKKSTIIPCGVDIDIFYPIEKGISRDKLGIKSNEKLVLFSGAFNNEVKNPSLAQYAVNKLAGVKLIELQGYNRREVALLMNAVDCCLMTSFSEGSPQSIKEAMACNCPIVSVDVGDVKEMINDVDGCYLVEYDEKNIADGIEKVFANKEKVLSNAAIRKKGLDLKSTSEKILLIYNKVLKRQ